MLVHISSASEDPYDALSQITRDLTTSSGVHTPKMDLQKLGGVSLSLLGAPFRVYQHISNFIVHQNQLEDL